MVIKVIKTVHVLTDTNIGGAGSWLLNYLKSYNRKKYSVCVAIPENSMLKPRISELDTKVYEMPGIADRSYSGQGVKEFKKLFKNIRPDIVHSHACLSARIAAKQLGIKIVNTRHCLEDKKRFPVSVIYGIINNYLSDIAIGVSKAVCDNLIMDGIKKEKVRLVYNGAYPLKELSGDEKMKIRERYKLPKDNVVVGIAARLEPVKNHELFLKAMKTVFEKNPNVSALIVGDGSLKDSLEMLAKELDIDNRVIFTGYQDDITEVMNIIDINVLSSKKEALSLSLIEGMFLKKASITTDCLGPCEVVENGKTGIIVENYNEQLLANAITELIKNEDLRVKMGLAGEKRAENLFSIKQMINSLDGIYSELIKSERK